MRCRCLAASRHTPLIALGSKAGVLRLVDSGALNLTVVHRSRLDQGPIKQMAFSPDGKTLAVLAGTRLACCKKQLCSLRWTHLLPYQYIQKVPIGHSSCPIIMHRGVHSSCMFLGCESSCLYAAAECISSDVIRPELFVHAAALAAAAES